MTNDTLYLKIEQNVKVKQERVVLGEIAQLECSNKELVNRLKTLKIPGATNGQPGRHVKSVMEIIELIHQDFPSLEVNNIGEADFIITYENPKKPTDLVVWLKVVAVCLLSFFGAAFTIMTFNNDADIMNLFKNLYQQFTGVESDGFTILEITYSIGVGLGILIFFNHFAGRKLTDDPTPMEVEMRLYEDDVNNTLIEFQGRQEKINKSANKQQ